MQGILGLHNTERMLIESFNTAALSHKRLPNAGIPL